MFSDERKKKKEDCIFQVNLDYVLCFWFFLHYSDNFQCSKAENGTGNMTDFVMSLLGIIHQFCLSILYNPALISLRPRIL